MIKSWQPHQRLFLYLLHALALACAISPILTLGADWFMTQWPALMPQRMPFHRTFNRAFMISGMVLFLLFRRALITAEVRKLFLAGLVAPRRDFLAGLGLAAGPILLIVISMTASGVLAPFLAELEAEQASAAIAIPELISIS